MDKKLKDRESEFETTMNQMETDKEEFIKFRRDEKALKEETARLENELKEEKSLHSADVRDLEKEKIQATEKLRKEMLYKIKETKANLLALNDEQLQTTTRLTILQNHQLTTELEY